MDSFSRQDTGSVWLKQKTVEFAFTDDMELHGATLFHKKLHVSRQNKTGSFAKSVDLLEKKNPYAMGQHQLNTCKLPRESPNRWYICANRSHVAIVVQDHVRHVWQSVHLFDNMKPVKSVQLDWDCEMLSATPVLTNDNVLILDQYLAHLYVIDLDKSNGHCVKKRVVSLKNAFDSLDKRPDGVFLERVFSGRHQLRRIVLCQSLQGKSCHSTR